MELQAVNTEHAAMAAQSGGPQNNPVASMTDVGAFNHALASANGPQSLIAVAERSASIQTLSQLDKQRIDRSPSVKVTASPSVSNGSLQAGYGFSMTDAGGVESARFSNATVLGPKPAPTPTELTALIRPFGAIDASTESFERLIKKVESSGNDVSMKDLMMTTAAMQTHSVTVTLVSSVVKSSIEGVQQLFRQQS